MKCGVIVNNYPHCPKCNNGDADTLAITDVDVARIDNEPHFELNSKCKKCGTKFYYFLNTEMFKRIAVDRKSERYSRTTKENVQDIMEEDFDE